MEKMFGRNVTSIFIIYSLLSIAARIYRGAKKDKKPKKFYSGWVSDEASVLILWFFIISSVGFSYGYYLVVCFDYFYM